MRGGTVPPWAAARGGWWAVLWEEFLREVGVAHPRGRHVRARVSSSESVSFSAQTSGKAHGKSLAMLIFAFWSKKKKVSSVSMMVGASDLWSLSAGGVLGTPFLSCYGRNTTVRPPACDHGPGFRRLSSPSLFLCFLTPVLVAAALLSELRVKIVSGLTLKALSFPRPSPVFKHLIEHALPSSGLSHYPASGSTVLEFII